MAEGLSVALPLRIDPIDGAYGLNRTLTQVAAQNLRMVILTSPGERIMFPEFGVGIRRYLFEQNTTSTLGVIRSRIEQQVSTYLPYIRILDLSIDSPEVVGSVVETDKSRVLIRIRYSVPSANVVSDLTIPVST
jgi:phage baseplate assembly protein W